MIVVFGSINIDLVTKVERIPAPGETVIGGDYSKAPGGKGANQALAARRAGGRVRMAGAYGRDGFADEALRLLRADGVDLAQALAVDSPTGAAFITVDGHGENAIVVASGANSAAKAEPLASLDWRTGDWLIMQREVPDSEVFRAAEIARAGGAKVFLNNAPALPLTPSQVRLFDAICVNETEAAILGAYLGFADRDPGAVAERLAKDFGVMAIATLGSLGAVLAHDGPTLRRAPPKVKVVDTTGAGDTFIGAFVAAMARGAGANTALREGLAAGSLACTLPGAQPSMPGAADIARLAASLPD